MWSKSHFTCQNEDWRGTKAMCWSPCTESELAFSGFSHSSRALPLSNDLYTAHTCTFASLCGELDIQFRMVPYWVCWQPPCRGISPYHINSWFNWQCQITNEIIEFILVKLVFRYTPFFLMQKDGNMVFESHQVWIVKQQLEQKSEIM